MLIKKLLLLLIYVRWFNLLNCEWCMNVKTVTRTRSNIRYVDNVVTYKSFFRVRQRRVRMPMVVSENYDVPELVRECCAGFYESHGNCVPACSRGCTPNSRCTLPEFCECHIGFKRAPDSPSNRPICQAICEQPCPENSSCVQFNVCLCNIGYNMSKTSNVCEPICTMACKTNEYCKEPEICECIDGYKRNPTTNLCEPQCLQTECGDHSKCVAPEQCMCEEGYALQDRDNKQLCVPQCEPNCSNTSYCAAPNACNCLPGYVSNETSNVTHECIPDCTPKCSAYEHCEAPNMCACRPGYSHRINGNANLRCEPDCPAHCEPYGQCLEPNKCVCHAGYELHNVTLPLLSDNQSLCQPKCSMACENGYCSAPETCYCNEGYLLGPSKNCEPVCSEQCKNGYCSAPNVCSCNEGYQWNADAESCEPVCEPACENGLCIDRNFCICHPGYEPNLSTPHICLSVCEMAGTCTTTATFRTDEDAAETTAAVLAESSTRITEDDAEILSTEHNTVAPLNYVSAARCAINCACWQEISEYDYPLEARCAHDCNGTKTGICGTIEVCACDVELKVLKCSYLTETLSEVRFFCSRMQTMAAEPENLMKAQKSGSWYWIAVGSLLAISLLAFVSYWARKRLRVGQHDENDNFIIDYN